ncbi:MAG: type II toxin-antitoxin system PemK/MazF family toxin [Eubacteriales bacterium]
MVTYHWQIFWANLSPAMGSEQAGKRPVLVVSAEEVSQALPVVAVLPITSAGPGRRIYPTEVFLSKENSGLPKDSIVMAHQVRTIAKERLAEKGGEIHDEKVREQVCRAISLHLGLVYR